MKKGSSAASTPKEGGFTLLEVVVAVVILGLAYVAVMQNLSQSTQNIMRIEKSGEKVLEQTLLLEESVLAKDEKTLADHEVYLKGMRIQLVIITGEESGLKTLKLTKVTP